MTLKDKCGAIIVTRSEASYSTISNILSKEFSPVAHAASIAHARQKMQNMGRCILVINTPAQDEFGVEGGTDIAMRLGIPVILLVSADVYDNTVYRTKNTGVFVLSRPLKGQILIECLNLCMVMLRRTEELKRENDKLRKRMEELSQITRAKCLLIERRGMTEERAHRYLEQEAMDRGLTKKEVAAEIIREAEGYF